MNPSCSICNNLETVKHIFIECPIVQKYWDNNGVKNFITDIEESNNPNWLDSLRKINTKITSINWNQVFPFLMWNIWLSRNHNYHNKVNLDIPISLAITRTLEFIHLAVKEPSARQAHTSPKAIRWTSPKIGFKINIDGSFNST
ncbi:hypothetical protein AABB24_038359 [Solanum stoloniferum]|uniref:Reverse transcriptase zinc-binding domain-containing protein n=1 Tax=Solanum stoloniferum TaxID=62892 RepID=A0ABD2QX72_9SOLN